MRWFRADLHVHTCLSPCAELEMSPRAIVETSVQAGLDVIAVCDHNSAENAAAAVRAGRGQGLLVLPGLEINSREEVHILAIFEKPEQALKMQAVVYDHLKGTNRPELFGDQVVVNEFDEVEGFNDRLLIGAVGLGIYDVITHTHRLGGVSIASHVDRLSFGLIGQLGFIPPDLPLDALELSRHAAQEMRESLAADMPHLPIVRSSDAHLPKDIGHPFTEFYLAQPSWSEIRLALASAEGRKIAA